MKFPEFKRIVLKLSGEILGDLTNQQRCKEISSQIQKVARQGIEMSIVVGGGNILRGIERSSASRVRSDYIGMLGTILNGIALQDALLQIGLSTLLFSAIPIPPIVPKGDNLDQMIQYLEQKKILIFTAGTGLPYFSTDTAAALRAAELKADIIFKGTKVQGVFDRDPLKEKDANMFSKITYTEILEKRLTVMDMTAIALCKENQIPIFVFNATTNSGISDAILGPRLGTLIE
jgi:uridylate kinase